MSHGIIPKDMALSSLTSSHITSKLMTSVEHMDKNMIDVERDIFELQDVALQMSDETLNIVHEISTVQNDFIELQYIQSLPWFCKSNFAYREVTPDQWNVQTTSDSSNQLFIRVVELADTYTGMFLILPRATRAGDTRCVSMFPKSSEACVYVSTNPNDAVRLTSFDLEWVPPKTGNDTERYLGHEALLAKPGKLNGYLFGSVFSSTNSNQEDQCVVFPDAGPFYVQTVYLDNNSGHTKIVFVFQKYKSSTEKILPGFSFYGVH
jgi:hypothetical protein